MAKLNTDEIKKMVEEKGYKFFEEEYRIVNNRKRRWIKIQCSKQHEPYWTRLDVFKGGHGCECCKNENYKGKWDKDSIIKFIEKEGYKLIEFIEFKKGDSKIKIKCKENHEHIIIFKKFAEGNRCPKCSYEKRAKNQTLSYEYVKECIEKEGYKMLSKEYISNKELIEIECNKHHIFKTTYSNFQQRNNCPYCNESKGEKEITRVLEKYNIDFFYNKSYFEDLLGIGGGLLRPDFIIEDKKIWIEYDGEQHYKPVDFANKGEEWANENHKKQVENDKMKDNYAKENNWKLIRISYWEFDNIENIIVNELNLK